jgi:hypothetical protein
MNDRNYDFCDDPLNELVDADQRIRELEEELAETQSQVQRWIPASEQLPEDGQGVIVFFEGGGMTGQVGEATFNKRGGWFSTERGAWGASHWMPLPEPPEAKPMLTAEDRESIESAITLTLKKMNFLGGATPEVK